MGGLRLALRVMCFKEEEDWMEEGRKKALKLM